MIRLNEKSKQRPCTVYLPGAERTPRLPMTRKAAMASANFIVGEFGSLASSCYLGVSLSFYMIFLASPRRGGDAIHVGQYIRS